jgi:hypothetical protein
MWRSQEDFGADSPEASKHWPWEAIALGIKEGHESGAKGTLPSNRRESTLVPLAPLPGPRVCCEGACFLGPVFRDFRTGGSEIFLR